MSGRGNRIQVGDADADADADGDEEELSTANSRERTPFSPSLFMAQAVGVIFPLVAITIFVFSMQPGNALAAVCRVLHNITTPGKP